MHELGITQEIVAIACEWSGGEKVRRIVVEIGKFSTVLPDAVRFCFALVAENTPAEGAELEIREIPGRARCRRCGEELSLDCPFGICGCGGTDLEWLSGEELSVKEMEVA